MNPTTNTQNARVVAGPNHEEHAKLAKAVKTVVEKILTQLDAAQVKQLLENPSSKQKAFVAHEGLEVELEAQLRAVLRYHGIDSVSELPGNWAQSMLYNAGKYTGVAAGVAAGLVSHIPGAKSFAAGFSYGMGIGYCFERSLVSEARTKVSEWSDKAKASVAELKTKVAPVPAAAPAMATAAATPRVSVDPFDGDM